LHDPLPTSDQAEATIRAAYPVVSGELRAGLRQETVETPAGIKVRLINDAPQAIWYEYGTVYRHTSLGYARGRMPAAKVFVPEVMRDRRALIDDLIPVVEAEGLTVRDQGWGGVGGGGGGGPAGGWGPA